MTLSNVPPFVSDEILTQALSRHGKLVSPIKKIPLRSESPLLKHIVSFRRFVYMIIPEDADFFFGLMISATLFLLLLERLSVSDAEKWDI